MMRDLVIFILGVLFGIHVSTAFAIIVLYRKRR